MQEYPAGGKVSKGIKESFGETRCVEIHICSTQRIFLFKQLVANVNFGDTDVKQKPYNKVSSGS